MSSTQSTRTTSTTTTTTTEGYYWERRKNGGALLPLAVGAAGLIGLGLLHGIPVRHSIESSLTSSATKVLADAGAPGVTVDFTGRDATLKGSLPDGVAVQTLIDKVKGINGVRVVNVDLTGGSNGGTATPSPSVAASPSVEASPTVEATPSATAAAALPSVTGTISGGKVVLTGTVSSQSVIDALVADATKTFGAGNVDNKLTVGTGISDDGVSSFGTVLAALGKDSSATAALADGTLTLSGTVAGADAQKAADAAAATVTGDVGKVQDQLKVASAPTAAPQQQLNTLPQITFDTASNTLTPAGYKAVQQAAAILKASPSVKVLIEGHTDDIGDAEVNRELSVARAQTVLKTLVSLGISADRMTYKGFGESQPKVRNTSDANRAANRRVQFVVQ